MQFCIIGRKIGETLMIGDGVTVTILGINGHQVSLKIHAPITIEIHRKETYNKIQKENATVIDLKDLSD